MLLREPQRRDDRKGNDTPGDEEAILQGIVFGDRRLVMFSEVESIDELMQDPEDSNAYGATQLLEEAVHGGGRGGLPG